MVACLSVSMFGAKKKCFNVAWYQRWDWWIILSSLMQLFAFLASILNLNLEEWVANQFRGMGCKSTFTTDCYHD